jgi:hypothetical protein
LGSIFVIPILVSPSLPYGAWLTHGLVGQEKVTNHVTQLSIVSIEYIVVYVGSNVRQIHRDTTTEKKISSAFNLGRKQRRETEKDKILTVITLYPPP